MNMKKIALLLTVLSLSGLALGACGAKNTSDNSKDVIEGNIDDITKDAVEEKTKVVDGQEVKEYTMADGNVIQIPVDGQDGEATDDSSSEE